MSAPRFRVEIRYAEHATDGDKFYKVMTVKSVTGDKSFALYNYGPRAVHMGLDAMSTGSTMIDPTVERGSQAGLPKWNQKRDKGYTRNSQTKTVEFATGGELADYITKYVGTKCRTEALRHARSESFVGVLAATPEPPPPIEPSLLDQHDDFGTW
jgi:hypothetical protein